MCVCVCVRMRICVRGELSPTLVQTQALTQRAEDRKAERQNCTSTFINYTIAM